MNDEILELAILGYQAYGDSAGWKNYQDKPMPTWDELPEAIKGHWRTAARQMRLKILADTVEK